MDGRTDSHLSTAKTALTHSVARVKIDRRDRQTTMCYQTATSAVVRLIQYDREKLSPYRSRYSSAGQTAAVVFPWPHAD